MAKVLLGLGSNLGNRVVHLRRALASLPPAVVVRAVSPLYETEPVGYLEQGPFLNAVAATETSLTPGALLEYVKGIERAVGRTPTVRDGPRVVDIDLLTFEDLILDTPHLVLPHPRLAERAFVLVPLAALAPEWRHPITRRTAAELLAALQPVAGVRLWERQLD